MTARPPLLLAAFCIALGSALPARAQLDDRLRLGGSYELYTGLRLDASPDVLAARNRAELLLTFGYDRGRIVLRPRLDYDALGEQTDGELREAFADVIFERVDLRLGRQILTWGQADGVFVTDLLAPLNLTEFLAQPFDDLRLGVTALTATAFLGDFEVTAVGVPRRPTTRLPGPGSPWYPLPDDVLGVPVEITEPAPEDSTLGAAEVALRATWRGLPRTDLAVLWMSGFNRLPAFRKGLEVELDPFGGDFGLRFAVTPAYERRHVFGATAETLVLDPFILRAEAAFHTSYLLDQPIEVPTSLGELLDPDFADAVRRGFLIEKPLVQAAVGVERAFGTQTFRAQGVGALVVDHDEWVAQDRFEPSASLLWLGRFRRDTVTGRAFLFYNLGADYWLNPEVSYAVGDGLNAAVGLQLFGGPGGAADLTGLLREPAFSFAAFGANDFIYLRLVYDF